MRQRLTIVIPTKNCEDLIEACLRSVTWADEIIIIDGFSTDKTLEICRKYTDRIIQYAHKGDYYGVGDEERNLGIDHASGDWILQLDSDEVVTDELRQDIEKILSAGGPMCPPVGTQLQESGKHMGLPLQKGSAAQPYCAYKFRRKNYFLGHFMRYGGWYHYSLHFFKRGKARYQGNIHETLIVEGAIGILEGGVDHYPFRSISQFIQRHNSYSDREAKMLVARQGKNGSLKEIKYHLLVKPWKLFWKAYVKKQGFRDGLYGLVFALLFAWVHFLNWAKYWELMHAQEH